MKTMGIKKIWLAMMVLGFAVMPVVGFAQPAGGGSGGAALPGAGAAGGGSGGAALPGGTGSGAGASKGGGGSSNPGISFTIKNPFKGGDNLASILTSLFDNVVIPLGSMLIVLTIIYSGFKFLTAQGIPADIKNARDTLLYALIGAALLLGAKGVSEVVQNTICDKLFTC